MLFLQSALQKKRSGKRTLHRPILQYFFQTHQKISTILAPRIALLVINWRNQKLKKCKMGLRVEPLWGEKSCSISLFCRFCDFIYNQWFPQSWSIHVHSLCFLVRLLESTLKFKTWKWSWFRLPKAVQTFVLRIQLKSHFAKLF